MKGGVWPNVRLRVIALAVAGTLTGTLASMPTHAQPAPDRMANPRSSGHGGAKPPHSPHAAIADPPASDIMMRTAVPPDLDQRRRDGHMTPEERRLLRQHIEDAVRELYKR
ncbi:hypothetical protein [Paraburkholderia saeva]|uniref:DUF4148 domain-containing protein n=1 Tax=Paraburkholderia saeva TaxID=2777537 RepID=A0A9N8RWY6_9BURK|nr:hypothetical protein [Paraburkholderia saeva]CAG4892145.1 hypothetical protein R52603_01349 [Paraburkholderia saeva]CAG4895181.1 hypothetical protein R70241_01926 [Paraburkholderia saeva]CAG4904471.1 hypothetical protein LMG31841_03352 [Paraburkholderia saeva]